MYGNGNDGHGFQRKKQKFNNNIASVAMKFQKNTNRNTALDKETIVELMKAVLKEEFEKTIAENIINYQQDRYYHKARNWKAKKKG